MKNLKILLMFMVTFQSFGSYFDECKMFEGRYSKMANNNDTFFSNGLEIKVNNASDRLVLKYNSDTNPRDWDGWIESYITDGNEYQGDQNTGSLYRVSCDENKITIYREGLLIKPMITTITLLDGVLHYSITLEGDSTYISSMQLLRVN